MREPSRRAARLAAVELLYAADVRATDPATLLEDREEPPAPYTEHLVRGVAARRAEIDRLLEAKAIAWSVERMSPVDRNVMRVAVLELMEGEVPPAAAIDEAVEMAKRFSGERAGGFVNGVLSAVRRELQVSDAGRSSGS